MAKRPKAAKKRGKRRTDDQVQELLGQVDGLCKSGEPLMKALDRLGISYSNYNYWMKKRGGATKRGKGRKAAAPSGGVFSVLDEMRANRSERRELEKQLRALDAKFDRLKTKLGRA